MWLFFVTQYNSSLSSFVPNFRILSQVVAEKSLTEKKSLQKNRQTDRQTNIITEKAKTIYPLYTSYRGYDKANYSGTEAAFLDLNCLFLMTLFLPKFMINVTTLNLNLKLSIFHF